MRVISCPKCWGKLQVAPEVDATTRPCPLCGALIQLPSAHNPIPPHRFRDLQQSEPWFLDGGTATMLALVMLCGVVVLACLVLVTFLRSPSTADAPVARSVPVEIRNDSQGVRARITNHSGVPLSRVAVTMRVFESGKSKPIISGVYHLGPDGSIARGETVDCLVPWRSEDKRAYARAKGALTITAEVSGLIDANGQALHVDLK